MGRAAGDSQGRGQRSHQPFSGHLPRQVRAGYVRVRVLQLSQLASMAGRDQRGCPGVQEVAQGRHHASLLVRAFHLPQSHQGQEGLHVPPLLSLLLPLCGGLALRHRWGQFPSCP
jgi:hypothetical protein